MLPDGMPIMLVERGAFASLRNAVTKLIESAAVGTKPMVDSRYVEALKHATVRIQIQDGS